MKRSPKSRSHTNQSTKRVGRPMLQIKMMHLRHQLKIEHSGMDNNKSVFRDETTSPDLHPIHQGMQKYFMAIFTHVQTMDIELEIAKDIAGELTKGFIKDLGAYFLEDQTKSQTPITTETITFYSIIKIKCRVLFVP